MIEILKTIDWTDVLTALIAAIFTYPLGRRKGRKEVLDPSENKETLGVKDFSLQFGKTMYKGRGGQFGVENLKLAAAFTIDLIKIARQYEGAEAVNVWNVLYHIRPLVLGIFNLLRHANQILLEVKELDTEDYQELVKFVYDHSGGSVTEEEVLGTIKGFSILANPTTKIQKKR